MRDHSTYLAFPSAGLDLFSCSKASMRVIPVAIGMTRHRLQDARPIFRNTSSKSSFVKLPRMVDPIALGWGSTRLPDRPTPWLKW